MLSEKRPELVVSECDFAEAEDCVEKEAAAWRGATSGCAAVASAALHLVSHALGGACIIFAPDAELHKLAPHAHASDGGGMTQRLKGVHVSSAEFSDIFHEFTSHTATDRWPGDYPDKLLCGRPKDGVGVLLSPSGFRVKCAVRLEGLPHASNAWSCMGMRHNAALAAIEIMNPAMVFIRSESGMVHLLLRGSHGLSAFCISDEGDCRPEDMMAAGGSEPTRTVTQSEILDEKDFDSMQLEAGKLVTARQELEEQLARLRWESGRRPGLDLARVLHSLGVLCRDAGDIVSARQHLEESLQIKRKQLGKDPSAEVADGLHELGLVFKEMRHLRMAQRTLEQALDMRQALPGAHDVAITRRELGAVLVERRHLRSAKKHFQNVAQVQDQSGDDTSPDRARTLRELGVLEMKGGNFHASKKNLWEALRIERAVYGDAPHPDVARTLYALGLVLLRSGEISEARSHLEESLKICRDIHGDTPHQDVQKVLRLLAALNVRDGNLSQWRDSCKEAVGMHKAIHKDGISALPAKWDMMGQFLADHVLAVKSQFSSIDNFMAAKRGRHHRSTHLEDEDRAPPDSDAEGAKAAAVAGEARRRAAAG